MQEASMVGEVARSMPRINATLDNHQEEYQSTMIECEGMIANQPVSVLFDPGAKLSYVSPNIVESCQLQSNKFQKPWLVKLTIGENRRLTTKTKHCPITISKQLIYVDLNILPLGSYNILIRMDW